MVDVTIPTDMWEEDDKEAVVVSWLYGDGANVNEGDLIVEIMVDKAELELNSPATGTLNIIAPAETIIKKGDVIAEISTD